MSTSSIVCTQCGGINPQGTSTCFACHSILNTQSQDDDQPVLLRARYHILTTIGSGGFATVYKARDTLLSRTVAIKCINLNGLTTEQAIDATDTFNREVGLLSHLDHPHIPTIFDHFSEQHCWYLVMTYFPGETLEHYLNTRRTFIPGVPANALPLEEVFTIAFQLCDLFTYLHTRTPSLIYRDLKPSNIMIDTQHTISLIDFGTARSVRPGQTKDTIPLGSPGYASPEQYGKYQITPRSDIYSLGALLHQLLSGDDPSASPFHFATLTRTDNPRIPMLHLLIQNMVATNNADRPESMQAVKQILTEIQQSAILASPTPRPFFTSVNPSSTASNTQTNANNSQQQTFQNQMQTSQAKSKSKTTRRVFIATTLFSAAFIGLPWLVTSITSHKPENTFNPKDLYNITWSPNRRLIASIGMKQGKCFLQTTTVLSSETDDSVYTDNPANLLTSTLFWSPDNLFITFINHAHLLGIWNINTNQLQFINSNSVNALGWLPDGHSFFVLSRYGFIEHRRAVDANILQRIVPNEPININTISDFAWSPDSRFLALVHNHNQIQLVDLTQKKKMVTWFKPEHNATITAIAWSHGSSLFAIHFTGIDLLEVRYADDIQQVHCSVITAPDRYYNSLLWSPDARYILGVDGTNYVTLYELPKTIRANVRLEYDTGNVTRTLAWDLHSQEILQATYQDNNISTRQYPLEELECLPVRSLPLYLHLQTGTPPDQAHHYQSYQRKSNKLIHAWQTERTHSQ